MTAAVDVRRVLRNASSLSAGEIAARGFSFLATLHLARVLGAERFGKVEFASAIVLYASTLSTFGLDVAGTSRVATDPAQAPSVARSVVALRLAFASLATLVLSLLSIAVPRFSGIRMLLLLTMLLVFAESISLGWVFQGLQRMRRLAGVAVLTQALYAAGIFVFVRNADDLLRVPVLLAAATAAGSAVLLALALRRFRGQEPEGGPGPVRSLLRDAAPIAANAAASLVVYNADVIILGLLADDRHVGLYRAAARITGVFAMLGAAFSTAVFPALAREGADPARFRSVLSWALRTSALAWAAGTALVIFTAPLLLRLTVGRAYDESVLVLRLLIVAAAVVGVRTQYRSALVALKQAGRNVPPTVAAGVTNVAMNLFLIPRYGLRGAAAATIAAESVLFALVWWEVRRALQARPG